MLVQLRDARLIRHEREPISEERGMAGSHRLMIVVEGRGMLELDGRIYEIARRKVCLLRPGMLIDLQTDKEQPLVYYRIDFDLWKPKEAEGGNREADTGPGQELALFQKEQLNVPPFGGLTGVHFYEQVRLAEQLCSCRAERKKRQSFREQALLNELLAILVSETADGSTGSAEKIEQTIEYMESRYRHDISRETLAGIAGMSVWHYSHVFKQRTGRSPMEYLNEIRMKRAKEQLLTSRAPIRDIARQVGFGDEFYFSRRFKKTVGVSPTAFLRHRNEKIAALSFPYTGHLMSLGVIPYVAVVDCQRDKHRQAFFPGIPYYLRRDKVMHADIWEHNLQVLAQAKPQLILCSEYEEALAEPLIRKIAPTAVISWMAMDWRRHFRQVAFLTGKEREAERWLHAYEMKAAAAGALIRASIGSETVSVVHIMQGDILVYGNRNAGAVLFGDLKLTPAYDPESIGTYAVIEAEDLSRYTGDHLLLIVDPDPASLRRWDRLSGAAAWRELAAVRSNRVYRQTEMPWLDYSPLAHDMIIDAAVNLFCRMENGAGRER
ncbi:helix-turn-helix domain-containing protein [Paenibacillus ehimensis]|uniref:AraC family transcriptional regulator n=1 Tax=Paenibacillus ehimensis TaxID=79264 RepID=UPI002DB866F4|nr:helix-turn-helix domain-containing protein [Paenibacillus ehimensis]MEC0211674.1 helix-turn-helix domain-containing protein [Paenibacillus ehimensis]